MRPTFTSRRSRTRFASLFQDHAGPADDLLVQPADQPGLSRGRCRIERVLTSWTITPASADTGRGAAGRPDAGYSLFIGTPLWWPVFRTACHRMRRIWGDKRKLDAEERGILRPSRMCRNTRFGHCSRVKLYYRRVNMRIT